MGFYLIGSRGIIWNQLQTISHCVNKICSCWNGNWKFYIHWILIEKIILIGWQIITNLCHEQIQARLLDSDFKQGMCRGMISLYLDVYRCLTLCAQWICYFTRSIYLWIDLTGRLYLNKIFITQNKLYLNFHKTLIQIV